MNDEINKQTEILKEILKWIKIGNMREVKQILKETLNSDTKRIIYNYSDGTRSIRDFKNLGIKSIGTISIYWNEWKKLGILEGVSVKRGERGKKVFNLEDFGIEIPNKNIKDNPNKNRIKGENDGSGIGGTEEAE